VAHHGAGSSGLSFATCAAEIRKKLPNAGIISLDARHHGSTTVINTNPTHVSEGHNADGPDFRLETLSRDLIFVLEQTCIKMGWTGLPDLVLVGHSLGGAVITDVAKRGDLGPRVLAFAVLDVVEGT
jgi:protein phosphatase methylesterase 1